MDNHTELLHTILTGLFEKYRTEGLIKKPGVFVSGGIDSSLITYYANIYFPNISLLSIGAETSKDKVYVDILSQFIKKPYTWIHPKQNELFQCIDTLKNILYRAKVDTNIMQLSLATVFYFLCQKAQNLGIEYVFTGQGPDILLAGYHKYKSEKLINEQIKKDLPLLEIDKKRDSSIATHFGIKLINPYLEKEFVDFCLSLPERYKIINGVEKYILRQYAKSLGVPQEIVCRPKKAMQYSTGIQKIVQTIIG